MIVSQAVSPYLFPFFLSSFFTFFRLPSSSWPYLWTGEGERGVRRNIVTNDTWWGDEFQKDNLQLMGRICSKNYLQECRSCSRRWQRSSRIKRWGKIDSSSPRRAPYVHAWASRTIGVDGSARRTSGPKTSNSVLEYTTARNLQKQQLKGTSTPRHWTSALCVGAKHNNRSYHGQASSETCVALLPL